MTYDDWKLETPEDEYARKHPGRRGGVYIVTMTRTLEATTIIEVEASNEEDALEAAVAAARKIPLEQWTLEQDDFDIADVVGPPERDPDDERDERMDREYDR